ncbi:Lovastatin diketide synthase LovF [Purpureocillium lavendulum]|uniref:Lovastatin diketide synthase LovF n=1 Tax=Purpureocillium lavendulum TaxID=1247861 RepID=A0AB34FX20_9HYPO|nr:Lovastatin diketide synthase LovF [Purpureocillium lavendulum]
MHTIATTVTGTFGSLSESLYTKTRQMLDMLDALQQSAMHLDPVTVSLEQIQAGILLAHYEFTRINEHQAMLTAGRALRLVHVSRLYAVDGAASAPATPTSSPAMQALDFAEVEERRRTFWLAFILDRFLSTRNEWPLTIHEEIICTRLPAPETNFEQGQAIRTDVLSEAMRLMELSLTPSTIDCDPMLALAHMVANTAAINLYQTSQTMRWPQKLSVSDYEKHASNAANFTVQLAKSVLRLNCFKAHVRGGHFLNEDIGLFDAAFFNFSAETAQSLDPQFRLQLESVYEALENAGLPLSEVAGSNTSVFAGTFVHDYRDAMMRDEDNLPRFLLSGIGSAMASNRISHFFDFRGASMTIDTGCSTTLVALHQAVQSLRNGESDMSIVGGSNVILNPDNFKTMSSLGFLSPDGKCFAFDDRANGYGRGEGVATLVIKRLKDAVAAGDPIRAVIRETLLNQDGKTETITSPSQAAQEALMRECYHRAGLDPVDTQYFEAHGTGTQTGDPIEAGAISAAFQGRKNAIHGPLRIGSIKTNIGHTEATSGLASVIKVVLSMEGGIIPPSINFKNPNPKLQLDEKRFKIATKLEPWPTSDGSIFRASVNNFGYGGSNAHVIMESHGPPSQLGSLADSRAVGNGINGHESVAQNYCLLILSAKDEQACKQMVLNLHDYLREQLKGGMASGDATTLLQRLAYTLGQRRTLFPWVAVHPVLSVEGNDENILKALDSPRFRASRVRSRQPRIGMVFTGQGAQWHAMGRELIPAYPVFEASLLEADAYIKEFGADWSLMEELHRSAEMSRVNGTAFSIPICVALQISLVRLLQTWGITPAAVTSHSSGEIAAAYTVGALSYRAAMGIAYHRSKLAADMMLQSAPKGGMIAVGLGRQDSEKYLTSLTSDAKAVVACVNSPASTTVAGDLAAILELEALLEADGVFGRRLRVETAYHSHHMDPIANDYREAIRPLVAHDKAKKPSHLGSVVFASPVTGYRITRSDDIADPEHWVNSLVRPVQFVDAFSEMVLGDLDSDEPSVDLVVEVGPHTALGGPIQQILELPEYNGIQLPYYGCLVRKADALESLQTLAANLLREGYSLDMEAINFPRGRNQQVRTLTNLPPYPWNHQTRHWSEPRYNRGLRERDQAPHELLGSLVPGTNSEAPTWRHILRASESPWVRDHVIQSNMLYPGCGFISLGIEAFKQDLALRTSRGELSNDAKPSGFQIRDVNVLQALVVPDTAEGIEIQTVLRPVNDKAIGVRGWKQFEVNSVTADNRWSQHATGLVTATFDTVHGVGLAREHKKREVLDPTAGYAKRIEPASMWNVLGSMGIQYGPTFKNIKSIIQSGKELRSVSTIIVPDTSVEKDLPRNHVVHPSTLDAAAQGAFTALPGTDVRHESSRVFQSIEHLWVSSNIKNHTGHSFDCHTVLHHADAQGIESDIVVVDSDSEDAKPVLEIKGLILSSLGRSATGNDSKPWEKELSSKIQWSTLPGAAGTLLPRSDATSKQPQVSRSALASTVDVISRTVRHNPHSRIMEVNGGNSEQTQAILQALGTIESGGPLADLYHITSATEDSFESSRSDLEAWSDIISFGTFDITQEPSSQGYQLRSYDDLIAHLSLDTTTASILSNLESLIKPGGRLHLLEETRNESGDNVCHPSLLSSNISSWDEALRKAGFSGVDCKFPRTENDDPQTLSAMVSTASPTKRPQPPSSDSVVLVTSSTAGLPPPEWLYSLQRLISASGPLPQVVTLESTVGTAAPAFADKICLFLGELDRPLLRDSDSITFEAIKAMTVGCRGLLWVTRGGLVDCENPELALASGFLRSIRNEYVGRAYITLDLDPYTPVWSSENASDIGRVLTLRFGRLHATDSNNIDTSSDGAPEEFEYAVRDGALMIPRVFKDVSRNKVISDLNPTEVDAPDSAGMEPLHQPDRALRLRVGMPGLLDTLAFEDDSQLSIEPADSFATDMIEIEPRAYGVNFRDVMVAMGQLHERVMGLECAGIITRVGAEAAANGYAAGDRVFCLLRGPFGTRVRIEWTSVMHIPAGLNFEEAASLPVIFCTAYMCLIDIAHLQRGQTVLIHAAAGGVGQAAIMVAKHLGAEIFATVGTAEKRKLVMDRYGIPLDHIFSSRDASFATGILEATDGRGVDVVLNSLAGPLLQESFNVLAPFGHFVEIGKRDLETNSSLEMRPFSRQVSFTAFYLLTLMHHAPRDVHRVLTKVAQLVAASVITPVYPITAYPISDVAKAFRGAGGIGRSISHWMVSRGARNLILLSRSAGGNGKSAPFVTELRKDGCKVKTISCDVANAADLKQALDACKADCLPPVRGVIQAAMVLRDTMFEQMTLEKFQTTIRPKVHGTWNLHKQFENADSLDFFVILSSAVGVVGNIGQTNYSAAGAYQDALARWRVARGLPAVSIDLGAVKSIGVAAETAGILGRLDKMGHRPLNEDQVLAVLSSAILAPHEPQVVVGLNSGPGHHWDVDGESQLGRDARFAALKSREAPTTGHAEDEAAGGGLGSLAGQLAAANSADEAVALVGEAIAEKLSQIFMLPVADIDLGNRPAQYGIDSLVAVELRNMLVQQAAAEISIFGIMQTSRGTRGPKKGYLKALRNRVVYLEAMLEGRMNAQRQRQEQQNMSGSSSTATLPTPPPLDISETAVALDQDQSWLPPVDIPPSEPEKQMPSDGGLLDFGLLADWSLTASVLPPTLNTNTDITDVVQAELYQLYFDRVHPSIPILHHRRYLSWSKSKTKTPAQKCLQYAMWTLATMLSAQYRDLIEPLYLEMKQMLEFLIGQESRHGGCDIELVQASVLVAVFESMRTYHRQAWLSAGRSFRLMQAMRFHTIDDPRARGAATAPTESGDAFIETEEKRRVFWMAYFLDHIFSMRNDWPITLNEHVICTRLPVPDADFQSGQAVVGDFLSEAMTATTLKAPSPFNECLILATICGRGLLRSQRQNISEAYGHMESDWGEQSHWLDSILTTRLHALTQDYPPPTEAYDPLLLFANILSQATVIYYCKGVMESASSPIGSLEANTEILGCQHQASMAAATIIRLANALRDLHFSKASLDLYTRNQSLLTTC